MFVRIFPKIARRRKAISDAVEKVSGGNGPELPVSEFSGGTKAITRTPVVGTPLREYAERFLPGEEAIEDGESRVTALGMRKDERLFLKVVPYQAVSGSSDKMPCMKPLARRTLQRTSNAH